MLFLCLSVILFVSALIVFGEYPRLKALISFDRFKENYDYRMKLIEERKDSFVFQEIDPKNRLKMCTITQFKQSIIMPET